jgi:hypothetical protein
VGLSKHLAQQNNLPIKTHPHGFLRSSLTLLVDCEISHKITIVILHG